MNKFKMSLFLVFVLLSAVIVSACSNGEETTKSGDEEVELRFIVNNDIPELVEQVEQFEAENENIKVNIETIPLDQFFEKVETMIAGNRAPDLLYTPVLATKRYANLDLLLDLAPNLSEDEKKDFLPSTMVSVQNGEKIYGLPHFTDEISLFYNKDLFEKAGVEVPPSLDNTWNWEEFLNAAEKVKEANGLKYGVSTGNDVSQFLPFLYQNNGSVLNQDQTAAGINTPASIEAIEWFKTWFDRGLASKEAFIGSEKADELFKQGKLPMIITFSGLINTFNNDIKDFEFGATYLPKQEVTATKLGGSNIVAFKNTKHSEAVVKLMKYLTSTEKMSEFSAARGVIPTRASAQEAVDYGSIAEDMKIIIDEVNNVPTFAVADFSIPEYLGYKAVLTSELQSVILGEKSPEEAAKEMERQINTSVLKK
ncbi:sugar ABC transporter substrate-binding protein [Bacillus sp. 31A1R]|uniref:Sugar ABC transporter substrate-binding protein n=1 Tax=Robertmurraya mangrovi TaxID=3098077 RepID=A0ABU5IWC4_9BACI|nr:sugar ABC transporter substrate-binding protein [Bacillus sp. 31A1R]MDZ5471463.1 sugar ABC transporter substrate-binding protein [Bacillus sp. 31A1R]